MNDTTQTLLRSILKIGSGIFIARGIGDQSTWEVITAGLAALIGIIWGVKHRSLGLRQSSGAFPSAPAPIRARPPYLPLLSVLFVSLWLILLTGCANFSSTQTAPDGTRTTVSITTLFDGRSEVAKLRTTQTDKTQGVSLGSLTENASGTNLVEVLRLLGNILTQVH